MAKLKKIVDFLNEELKIDDISDSSYNGLQVEGKQEVKKIGFAVDACLESFQRAKKEGCDLVIVHHGLLWDKEPIILTGIMFKRVKLLIENQIALYATHLPLDKHEKHGNNIQLAKLLDLKNIEEFGDYHGTTIGFKGEFEKELDIKELTKLIDEKLNTKCEVLQFGKDKIKSVGIVSGTGDTALEEAKEKVDALFVGDRRYSTIQRTKDCEMTMIIGGHYQTETWGVKALMPLLKEKFGVETVFIEYDPTQ